MEEGVKDINDDNNEIYDEEKEAQFHDDTSPDEMEDGVNDRNDNKNEIYDKEKRHIKQYIMITPQLVKVKQ